MDSRLTGVTTTLALACWFLTPARAPAWGSEGHVIVAKIAELNLKPGARLAIGKMLGTIPISDRRIANFADFVKRNPDYPRFLQSAPWHFVDIPVGEKYDKDRDGNGGANVIDKITEFKKTLADKDAKAEERLEALLFIVHLVGDLHQPLHCATREDHGGNSLKVKFLGHGGNHLNLHSAWDTDLVRAGMKRLEPGDYAFRLNGGTRKEDRSKWQEGTPEDWANESNAAAAKFAYRDSGGNKLPTTGAPNLDDAYIKRGVGVVEGQLRKGGIRLAKILNDALSP
jgi:hypothetical protein